MAVDPDQKWRRNQEGAVWVEHLEYIAYSAIAPKHMLEDLLGENDVEFFVKNSCANVEIRIAYGPIAGKAKVLPLHAADFQRRGMSKIQPAHEAGRFLIHDDAKPVLVAARMQLRPCELVGFLHPRNALEL